MFVPNASSDPTVGNVLVQFDRNGFPLSVNLVDYGAPGTGAPIERLMPGHATPEEIVSYLNCFDRRPIITESSDSMLTA